MDALHPLPNKANHGLYYKSRNFEYYFQIIIDKKICISKYCYRRLKIRGTLTQIWAHLEKKEPSILFLNVFWHKILCATPFNVFCLFFSNSCPAIRILELFAKILRSAKICVSIYALICVHYPDMTLCVVDRNLSQSAWRIFELEFKPSHYSNKKPGIFA